MKHRIPIGSLLRTVAVFSATLWLVSCSGPFVRTDYDRSVHFAELHTYAWQPAAGHFGAGLPNDPDLDIRIRSTVDAVLSAKGLRVASQKDADLLLEYEASAEKQIHSDFKHYETAEFMNINYALGTLDLKMTRSSSPSVVWQGRVQANIDRSRPLDERDRKLREAVQKLLEKFPPQ
jgi:hypothetical protein